MHIIYIYVYIYIRTTVYVYIYNIMWKQYIHKLWRTTIEKNVHEYKIMLKSVFGLPLASYQVIQGLQILRWFPDSKSSTIHIASKRLQTLSKLTFRISFRMLMLYTLYTNYMSFSSRSPFSHVFSLMAFDTIGHQHPEEENHQTLICLVNTSNGWASEVVDIMLVSKDYAYQKYKTSNNLDTSNNNERYETHWQILMKPLYNDTENRRDGKGQTSAEQCRHASRLSSPDL